jgi:hypothetical protein
MFVIAVAIPLRSEIVCLSVFRDHLQGTGDYPVIDGNDSVGLFRVREGQLIASKLKLGFSGYSIDKPEAAAVAIGGDATATFRDVFFYDHFMTNATQSVLLLQGSTAFSNCTFRNNLNFEILEVWDPDVSSVITIKLLPDQSVNISDSLFVAVSSSYAQLCYQLLLFNKNFLLIDHLIAEQLYHDQSRRRSSIGLKQRVC